MHRCANPFRDMWRGWLTRLAHIVVLAYPELERGSLFNCFTCATMRDNRGRIIQEEYKSVYRQYLQLPAQGFASWWHKV